MEMFFIPILIIAAFILIGLLFYVVPVRLWIESVSAGAPVNIFSLVFMRLRSVNPHQIVRPYIMAKKAGIIEISVPNLEAHYMSIGTKNPKVGERMYRLVTAIISADKANLRLTVKQAMAIDLAGRDVLEAVHTSVKPKIIETPKIAAVAKNGIQVMATARVTVRTNIEQLVGGAGEETIIARVGEGIVTTIGSAESHKEVLENPDKISKTVLEKGLDSGTAFEILSIDIADVDVGKNIGAHLQTDQAEADKKIAQAKAEERRAMAFAREQEMHAQVEEMRAKVVEAEAEIPMAIAQAFRNGKLGVLDYYNLKNLQADTEMRSSIGGGQKQKSDAEK